MQDTNDPDMSLLSHRLGTLHADVGEMKAAMKELTTAITKLALIEERQSNAASAQERAFIVLAKLEERVSKLEQLAPANKRVNIWLDRATWAGLGLLAMLVVKKSGLL
jgi:regulator of replication initiation timing